MDGAAQGIPAAFFANPALVWVVGTFLLIAGVVIIARGDVNRTRG